MSRASVIAVTAMHQYAVWTRHALDILPLQWHYDAKRGVHASTERQIQIKTEQNSCFYDSLGCQKTFPLEYQIIIKQTVFSTWSGISSIIILYLVTTDWGLCNEHSDVPWQHLSAEDLCRFMRCILETKLKLNVSVGSKMYINMVIIWTIFDQTRVVGPFGELFS